MQCRWCNIGAPGFSRLRLTLTFPCTQDHHCHHHHHHICHYHDHHHHHHCCQYHHQSFLCFKHHITICGGNQNIKYSPPSTSSFPRYSARWSYVQQSFSSLRWSSSSTLIPCWPSHSVAHKTFCCTAAVCTAVAILHWCEPCSGASVTYCTKNVHWKSPFALQQVSMQCSTVLWGAVKYS